MTKYCRIVFFIVLFLFAWTPRVTAAPPKPTISVLDSISPVKLYFNDDTGFRDAEITPWSLENKKLGGNYLYLVTSYNTHLCDTISNIFSLTSYEKVTSCKLRQTSAITPKTATLDPNAPIWSRDYSGSFSGHLVNTNNGYVLFSINHHELLNNNYFPSQPCRQAPDLGYGVFPCTTNNTDISYNAFVGMSSFAFDINNFNSNNLFLDSGPIVWPANGYVDAGKKATNLGILHPSSIIKDGYLYVFFRDTSYGTAAGRTKGLKVARAPITTSGIDPHSFKTYFQGSFTDSALPSGFSTAQILNYFSVKGGRSSPLFDNSNSPEGEPDVYSFSAAKLTGTKYFLGVGQDLRLGITLRLSTDLVHWGNQTVIPGTEFNYFTDGGTSAFIKEPFMYPRLASADGDSNVEVDPNNFYVIGTSTATNPFSPDHQAKIVNRMKLKLLPLPSPSPSPSPSSTSNPKQGDLNTDGKVDISDYNAFIPNYGKTGAPGFSPADIDKNGKVNIFDYNQLVANFGK